MWDVFFSEQEHTNDQHIMQLIDAVHTNQVTEQLLEPCIPALEQQLGCTVKCLVIPYARTDAEQIQLLQRIAHILQENDHISIDVTHSFRHLPMLALVASRFLQNSKSITTRHIYYGALDMTESNNLTPVVQLDGLLKMLDWVDALSAYNANGSYQVFSPLFQQEQAQEAGKWLERAAFYEETNQIGQARTQLKSFHNAQVGDSPLIALFHEQLQQRTQWSEQGYYNQRQLEMAKLHFAKGDYLRASILAQEAWISKMVQHYAPNADQQNHDNRNYAKGQFRQDENQTTLYKQFQDLSHIRNALAHGSRADVGYIQAVLQAEHLLKEKFNEIYKSIEQYH